jgi:hypothetical protein
MAIAAVCSFCSELADKATAGALEVRKANNIKSINFFMAIISFKSNNVLTSVFSIKTSKSQGKYGSSKYEINIAYLPINRDIMGNNSDKYGS